MKKHVTVLTSAARTATSTTNFTSSSKGGILLINVTAIAATPSVTFALNGVDPNNETGTYNIITSAAVTATGQTALSVYPGIAETANISVSDILPEGLQVVATHADADSITYTVHFIGVD